MQEHGDVNNIPRSSCLRQIIHFREDITSDEVRWIKTFFIFEQGVSGIFETCNYICAVETGWRCTAVSKCANILTETCSEIEEFGIWCCRCDLFENTRVIWMA